MARGSKSLMWFITAMMLTSLFAGINFDENTLHEPTEMETGGRSAYEVNLLDVLQPRETFVDQSGNTHNAIDVGDVVYFRPLILNEGYTLEGAMGQFPPVDVLVYISSATRIDIIQNRDHAVCSGDIAITGCSFNNLTSGDFLGDGNYRVRNQSGGDLAWTPTIPGEYTVTVTVELSGVQSSMMYNVTVQHYRDIVVDLCWTDGPGGNCTTDGGHGNVQGAGPHNFALTVTAEGTEEWNARSTAVLVTFQGDYDADESSLDMGAGSQTSIASGNYLVDGIGTETNVEVFHNLSNPESWDMWSPCWSNPCSENRDVLTFEQAYTFHGIISGDEAASSSGPLSFMVSAELQYFDYYEASVKQYESGNGYAIIAEEVRKYFDDRTCNNGGTLSGYFTVMHDIVMDCIIAGENDATEGTLNAGTNRLTAQVLYGGSGVMNYYDWEVGFNVVSGTGQNAIVGDGMADECLDEDPEIDYSHTNLGQMAPSMPIGTACIDVDLTPGLWGVTATSTLLNSSSDPNDATDMVFSNNYRATWFEVINDNPAVFMTLDDINRDGAAVDPPVIQGDSITMRARGFDTETPDEELLYSWSRITSNGETIDISDCDQSICTVQTDSSWRGERMVTSTVTDGNGASASDSMLVSVFNNYSTDMTVAGANMSYSILYKPMVNYNVTAVDAGPFQHQEIADLDNYPYFESVVAFNLTVSNLMMPTDVGTETLSIDFDDNGTSFGFFKRNSGSSWDIVSHMYGEIIPTTGGWRFTVTHDGSMGGNLADGTYAILRMRGVGDNDAPEIENLTATLLPSHPTWNTPRIELQWEVDGAMRLGDEVYIHWCKGTNCNPEYPFGGNSGSKTSYMDQGTNTSFILHQGFGGPVQDGEHWNFMIRVENYDNGLYEEGAYISAIADGSVSPTPEISNLNSTEYYAGLNFIWDATNTTDVNSWVLCWDYNEVMENGWDGIFDNYRKYGVDSQDNFDHRCVETSDEDTAVSISEETLCGWANYGCDTDSHHWIYFGIAAKDSIGNIAVVEIVHLDVGQLGDADADGIEDDLDECPQTPPEENLVRDGCSGSQIDADADGIEDDLDECPQTPPEENLVRDGCSESQIDDDNDGVNLLNDECPTIWGNASSHQGCLDTDGDGWADGNETCPTLWGSSTVRDGCPDSDYDQIIDPEDGCPQLAGTSILPTLGCPDSDGDGWADTNDAFPSNDNEWDDADMDNVGDNSDQCPNTTPDVLVNWQGCELPESSNLVVYTAVGGGSIVGASLLFFMLPRMMRKMNAEEAKEQIRWEDEVWQDESQGLPQGPPTEQTLEPEPGLIGETQPDGYEYLEWPAASDDWWYRAGAGLDWSKWEK